MLDKTSIISYSQANFPQSFDSLPDLKVYDFGFCYEKYVVKVGTISTNQSAQGVYAFTGSGDYATFHEDTEGAKNAKVLPNEAKSTTRPSNGDTPEETSIYIQKLEKKYNAEVERRREVEKFTKAEILKNKQMEKSLFDANIKLTEAKKRIRDAKVATSMASERMDMAKKQIKEV
ncbi:hypothetical protein BS50DRAFT_592198 [Corynespora cassiicola Philippines]|uniref:Uncharacterized protein n=1 Tax=Corynespora cassiicola Philippines TaxID=1448308 RepID=A0A2T2N9A6_CORCC|nr:hypothetical protein BS50DRAFT_592198 [Corynespora cassiicola Philippines]